MALALALHHPLHVAGLVLVSGYYYPTPRTDVALFSPPAIPLLGDLLSHTVAPLIGEAIAPGLIEKMFSPQGVSPRFAGAIPGGVDAAAVPDPRFRGGFGAHDRGRRDAERPLPFAVPAHGDPGRRCRRIVSYRQAQRLHGEVGGSRLEILQGGSHMVHHIAPDRVVHAIDAVASESSAWRRQAI